MNDKTLYDVSHPVRGAWIEISDKTKLNGIETGSHPVRGAWIEIELLGEKPNPLSVASRKGCVD